MAPVITRSGMIRHILHALAAGETLMLVANTDADVGVPAHIKGKGTIAFKVVKGTNDYQLTPHGLVVYMGFNTLWTHCVFPYEHILGVGYKGMTVNFDHSDVSSEFDGPLDQGRPTHVPYLRVYEGGRKDPTPELPPAG